MNDAAPLSRLPTHLLAGPLGAGKTTTLRHLLGQRPAGERWAVLVNEFGQIGLDAALLGDDAGDGVQLAEVAGGCLCCVNGLPFQVGLNRLLRRARPQRLFIEPSGLGHPLALLEQLHQPPWDGVLAVQPAVLVLDAAALAAGQALPDSQRATLPVAGLVLMNKSAALDTAVRQRLAEQLPAARLYWTEQGGLPLGALPGAREPGTGATEAPLPDTPAAPPTVWLDPSQPECRQQHGEGGWSIGWRWHPVQRFDLDAVTGWLANWPWRRAKLIVQTVAGARSANALDGQPPLWRDSEWRRDSRLELIFDLPQDAAQLGAQLAACRQP